MPSNDDRFDGDQCRIKTNPSGGYFHLYNEGDTSEIKIIDIACALSRQCRFTGHLLPHVDHYSVAEHCVLVSHIIEKKLGGDDDAVFAGLMHDAAEAYLSDIAAPFKREIGDYYGAEKLIMDRIAKKYNLILPLAVHEKLIKDADWLALFYEARYLVNRDEEDLKTWIGYETNDAGKRSLELDLPAPACWNHVQAAQQFLMRFAALTDRVVYG